jgi:hypothetical protein
MSSIVQPDFIFSSITWYILQTGTFRELYLSHELFDGVGFG